MAKTLQNVIESLHAKIETLSERADEFRRKYDALEAENQELRLQLKETEEARDRARLDAEFLTVSHRLAQNPDTIVDSRRLIAGLIRNIDRCIDMMKE